MVGACAMGDTHLAITEHLWLKARPCFGCQLSALFMACNRIKDQPHQKNKTVERLLKASRMSTNFDPSLRICFEPNALINAVRSKDLAIVKLLVTEILKNKGS